MGGSGSNASPSRSGYGRNRGRSTTSSRHVDTHSRARPLVGRRGARARGLLRNAREQRRDHRVPNPGGATLEQGVTAPQPAGPPDLGADEPHPDPMTPSPQRDASLPEGPLRRHQVGGDQQAGCPGIGVAAHGVHQRRMDSTANCPVSASVLTLTHPVFAATSYTPYRRPFPGPCRRSRGPAPSVIPRSDRTHGRRREVPDGQLSLGVDRDHRVTDTGEQLGLRVQVLVWGSVQVWKSFAVAVSPAWISGGSGYRRPEPCVLAWPSR